MPNVKDLRLNLYDEEHVDFIMKTMPQLLFLNSLPVEREEEYENYQPLTNETEECSSYLIGNTNDVQPAIQEVTNTY